MELLKDEQRKIYKSVHITNYYHENSGGISMAYNRLLEAANRHGRYVRLIVPGAEEVQKEIGEYGRIYYIKARPAPVFDKRYRLLLPFHYLKDETPVRKVLESEMPDMIEIGEKYLLSLLAGLIKKGYLKTLNRPMLVHFSHERMDDNLRSFVSGLPPFGWFARRVMGNYIFPMFDFHVANSDYTAQELFDAVSPEKNPHRSETFFRFCHRFFKAAETTQESRVVVNFCGVDSDTFHPTKKNTEFRRAMLGEAGFPENATVLLYAGRISPEKNVKLLPEVMRSLVGFYNHDPQRREYRLLIAGDGPQTAWLKKKLERYVPGKFKFLGHVSDKEKLASIYANADIFVHPNPREPFSIAPLEAMAAGVPVVAPDAGGLLSYANDDNSWLNEPKVQGYFREIRDVFQRRSPRGENRQRFGDGSEIYLAGFDGQSFRGLRPDV